MCNCSEKAELVRRQTFQEGRAVLLFLQKLLYSVTSLGLCIIFRYCEVFILVSFLAMLVLEAVTNFSLWCCQYDRWPSCGEAQNQISLTSVPPRCILEKLCLLQNIQIFLCPCIVYVFTVGNVVDFLLCVCVNPGINVVFFFFVQPVGFRQKVNLRIFYHLFFQLGP